MRNGSNCPAALCWRRCQLCVPRLGRANPFFGLGDTSVGDSHCKLFPALLGSVIHNKYILNDIRVLLAVSNLELKSRDWTITCFKLLTSSCLAALKDFNALLSKQCCLFFLISSVLVKRSSLPTPTPPIRKQFYIRNYL